MLNKREINRATRWSLGMEEELYRKARKVVRKAARDSIINCGKRPIPMPLSWTSARKRLDDRSEAIIQIAEALLLEKLQPEKLFEEEVLRAEEIPSAVS